MNFDIKTEQVREGVHVIALAGEVDLYTCLLYTSPSPRTVLDLV